MLRLASALAVLALAAATRDLKPRSLIEARKLTMSQSPSTEGWWGSMVVYEDNVWKSFCGLRDFPPIPNGYGTARMLCGGYMGNYDHFWMWRISSVENAKEPYPSTIVTTGEPVYMEIFVPMLPWCGLDRAMQIQCGYRDTEGRSEFIIENMDGTPGEELDLATDRFYLKSGGRYCSRQGKGNSAYIKCIDSTPKMAFGLKPSSYYKMSISSVAASQDSGEDVPCGFNFIPLAYERAAVNCTTVPPYIPSNYATEFFASIKPPGAVDGVPSLVSGMNMTFKAHDSLYKYQVSNWVCDRITKKVVSYDNDTEQAGQWFTISVLGGEDGDMIEDGDTITIKSAEYDLYCGVSASSQIVCDMEEMPSESDAAYLFTAHISSA